MRRQLLAACGLALVAAASLGGCQRAVGEAVTAFTGAEGMYIVIEPISPVQGRSIGQYNSFEVQPFEDRTGTGLPATIPNRLEPYIDAALAEKKIINQETGTTMIIRGTYVFFQDKNETLDKILGPFSEVVARVQLVDAASGDVIGEANCVGRAKYSASRAPEDIAKALAEGIVNWISEAYPETRGG